jgi:peptide/nickel transport system permease protein
MSLVRYLAWRGLVALVLIVVVSSAALLLALAAPPDTSLDAAERVSAEEARARLGLNRPVLVQYADWMDRAIHFDFGQSLIYTRPVNALIGERVLNTAVLAATALGLATAIGLPLGMYTGRRSRGPGVMVVRALSLLLLSTPPLLASLVLVLIAARTGWLPVGGMVSAAASNASWQAWALDVMTHLPLPALALALPLAAVLERLQSQALKGAIDQSFVQAARARGLSRERAELVHAWRVSLGPILGIYGAMVGALFSGSFVVEVVTAWPGLGRLMFDALRGRDIFLVAGCAAAGALSLSVGTLLSDVMLAVVDPRVRMGGAER